MKMDDDFHMRCYLLGVEKKSNKDNFYGDFADEKRKHSTPKCLGHMFNN